MLRPLIVTGMHRSGTSLVASLFQEAGVSVGEKLLAATRVNPQGFFEDVDLYDFHERALRERGESLFVQPGFAFTPTSEEIARARALVEQRQLRPLWGWKDPRTSLFLEFWYQLLPEARFVFLYRHPLDVLLSLMRRRDLYSVGLLEGLEAWCIYNSKIRQFYEAHKDRAALCHIYSITDHIEEFQALLRRKWVLDLSLNQETLAARYHPEDLRRVSSTLELEATIRIIYPQAAELYERLNSLADLPFKSDPNGLPSSDLSALLTFASCIPMPLDAPRQRSLLLFLVSCIDAQVTETFFREQANDISTLALGKAWLEEQRGNWQRLAEERERIVQEQRAWIAELEQGKAWLEEQRDQAIQQQRDWIQGLERGKAWLEEQRSTLLGTIEQRDQAIQQQRGWIRELERGKAWLEEQRGNWQRLAEERERIIQEQRTWIAELEQGKAWLEEQRQNWEKIAQEQRAQIKELQQRHAKLEA